MRVGSFFSILVTLFLVFFTPDNIDGARIIGAIALFFSYLTINEVKDNMISMILFSIIFYVNLSIYVLGPLTLGNTFNDYQFALWKSGYDAIGMKNLLISSCAFMCIMKKRENNFQTQTILPYQHYLENNPIIALGLIIVVLLISIFGFSGSVGDSYESNSNALFEYAILFMMVAWFYGGRLQFVRLVWCAVCAFYILIAVLAGDRSSAFMMLLLIALYHLKRVNLMKISVFCVLGILSANVIEMYRINAGLSFSASDLFSRGLQTFFSNTAAQSYYTSLTIYDMLDNVSAPIILFVNWIITIFTGSAVVDRSSVELSSLASFYQPNGGGGFFHIYFYLAYRYFGVALSSTVVALLIRRVFMGIHSPYTIMLGLLLTSMSFRWYLYSPTTLFRTCLVNFSIVYLITKFANYLFSLNK